jgi:exosortase/archaeosortase family protein
VLYGHFTNPRGDARVILAVAAIPIAVIANGIRVAGTGIAASHYGAVAAEGFFHTFSGWLMFVVALSFLMATGRAIAYLWPADANRETPAVPEEASCVV